LTSYRWFHPEAEAEAEAETEAEAEAEAAEEAILKIAVFY
jgi:hypothetical protein